MALPIGGQIGVTAELINCASGVCKDCCDDAVCEVEFDDPRPWGSGTAGDALSSADAYACSRAALGLMSFVAPTSEEACEAASIVSLNSCGR